MVGSSLTQFELNYIAPDEPVAGSASLVFESLMLYGKGIEVLRFITASGINKDDLQVLANPRCMPHLKELTLDGCECTVEMDEAHPGKESGKEEEHDVRQMGRMGLESNGSVDLESIRRRSIAVFRSPYPLHLRHQTLGPLPLHLGRIRM